MADAISNAKSALAHANKTFPSPAAKPAAAAAPTIKPAAKPSNYDGGAGIGAELKAKSDNVDEYVKSLPKMKKGGPVIGDGPRMLHDGEHVLTAAEAKKARKHALMAVGMKSLAKEPSVVKPAAAENDEVKPMPSKKSMSGINAKPAKAQVSKTKIS